MVGVYGTTREKETLELESGLENLGNEGKISKNLESLTAGLVKHSNSESSYIKKGSKHCWAWGKIKGHYAEDGNGYRQRNGDTADILLDFYENNEVSGLDRLNGEFFAAIFDEEENTLKLITDRLGSRVAFYTTEGENITFSNDIQSLCRYTGKKELIEDYCIEFLAYKRVFGTKTPFKDVEKLPPASVTTFNLENGELNHENYWQPEYEPEDKPYSYFVDKFTEIFQQIIEEEIEEDKSYGLMLSGGSDSRLIAGAIDQQITCYHANEWMNTEAKIAEKVAGTAGHKFEFLERDEDYQPRALKENTEISKFVSNFNQAHFYGFRDKLTEENDILIHGLFADTFFKGYTLDRKSVNIKGRELILPIEDESNQIEEFIQQWKKSSNIISREPHKILKSKISENSRIQFHDIDYARIDELTLCFGYYPLTNDEIYLHYDHMLQIKPTITPFLDIRLIDLHLQIPRSYFLSRNIINASVKETSPALSKIKSSGSKIPSKYPKIVHYASNKLQRIIGQHTPWDLSQETKKPHHSKGSWTNHVALLRENDFALNSVKNNREIIDELSFLEKEDCIQLVKEHQEEANNYREIYKLVTFLESLEKIEQH